MNRVRVSICIISSAQDPFSLCFLDVARYFRYHLRGVGVDVKPLISKNRLFYDHVNIVFGAHVVRDLDFFSDYACVFVNLEQLGSAGKRVSGQYLELLGSSYVIDYDSSNLDVLTSADQAKTCLVSLGCAEYLNSSEEEVQLSDRPIDVLFFGSINEKRKNIIERIAAAGVKVSVLNSLFGPERDAIVSQSKLVLNISFYEKEAFEQVRVFQCLSLGTPVLSISERASQEVPEAYNKSVFFADPDGAIEFFANYFKTGQFFIESCAKLAAFRERKEFHGLDGILSILNDAKNLISLRNPVATWLSNPRINIGSGRKYMNGWLNVDINPDTSPDVVLDLSCSALQWPLALESATLGSLKLDRGLVATILADNVIEHIGDLTLFMTNCLELLREKGRMIIVVPYHRSNTAWQDPTHVRAFNENSWIYYTDWFWYLGWFEYRFSILACEFLDMDQRPASDKNGTHFMRVDLEKIKTSPVEKNIARLQRGDFGPLPRD